jgi:CDP-glycerol glycerophosphotransferase (TagB/SpsB family)
MRRAGNHRARAEFAVALGARLVVGVLTMLYAALKLLPVRRKVVLMSRLYSRTSQDFERVRDEINRQDPTLRVVVLNHRNTNPLGVPGQMLQEMYHLATSRACITDSYMAALSVLRHRESLVVVQMWHALGAVKRFGLAALDTDEGRSRELATAMRMHQGYNWVIAGGRRMVGPFAEAFGVAPSQVLPIGTPRVDMLHDPQVTAAKRARIHRAHPYLGTRPLVLYAPTFRKGAPVRVDDLLDALGPDDFDVVVTLHPLDHRDFSDRPAVVQDRTFSTLDWLAVADHVVTDYSAIVFDAAVVGVPLYFFAYDLAEYRTRRGLFLDYEHDMPGPVATDAKDVVAAIERNAIGGTADAVAAVAHFRDEFVAPSDGGCTRRIVALALGASPSGLR